MGKITVETPPHTVVRAAADGAYEIRQYGSSLAAEVRSADWVGALSEREFSKVAFPTLARYIGVFGEAENVGKGGGAPAPGEGVDGAPEKMAMTAPVVMAGADGSAPGEGADGAPEKLAMTAPVVMASTDGPAAAAGGDAPAEKMAMTAPVVMASDAAADGAPAVGFTMAFLLPAKYGSAAEAPRPKNEKVHLRDVPPRTVAVRKYSGNTTMEDCGGQVKGLMDALARDGVATAGPWTLQRYNPPFSLPWTKTNEIHVPVEGVAVGEGEAAPAAA